jgi:drug/metabolite transporter (DMT)-like permease
MICLVVFISVAAMTAAQLLLKRGLHLVGAFPGHLSDVLPFFLKAFTNIYVISAVLFTIVTALAWILTVSKAQLSFVYPFMALSYAFVALFSLFLFKEGVTALRWVGIIVICVGVFLVSRS